MFLHNYFVQIFKERCRVGIGMRSNFWGLGGGSQNKCFKIARK